MERSKIICLLPKSPLPKKGRIGPEKWQNWWFGCKKAARVYRKYSSSKILIPSSFQISIGFFETDFYRRILYDAMYVPFDDVEVAHKGYETVSQIQWAIDQAIIKECDLIIVWSCLEHFLRWFLIKNWLYIPEDLKISHKVALLGIPRPMEWAKDIAILVALIIIKLLNVIRPGTEKKFKNKILSSVKKRRAKGKV